AFIVKNGDKISEIKPLESFLITYLEAQVSQSQLTALETIKKIEDLYEKAKAGDNNANTGKIKLEQNFFLQTSWNLVRDTGKIKKHWEAINKEIETPIHTFAGHVYEVPKTVLHSHL